MFNSLIALCVLLSKLDMWTHWQLVCCAFSGEDEEEAVCQESQVTQEMLEEQLVRLLTREVLDLLCKFQHLK